MVLDAVNEMHRHVTADQIYTFIKEKYPSIGRGTVYRNLGILVEEGKVRKVEVPDGSDRFDFTLENHYHVECVKCGEIFDVDMDVISELEKKIKDTHGMKYISHDIFFKGICQECQKERNERCIDWRIKMLEVGTKAPDFELPDQNGELHKLSEYLGKKVKKKNYGKYPWVWSEQHILLTNME